MWQNFQRGNVGTSSLLEGSWYILKILGKIYLRSLKPKPLSKICILKIPLGMSKASELGSLPLERRSWRPLFKIVFGPGFFKLGSREAAKKFCEYKKNTHCTIFIDFKIKMIWHKKLIQYFTELDLNGNTVLLKKYAWVRCLWKKLTLLFSMDEVNCSKVTVKTYNVTKVVLLNPPFNKMYHCFPQKYNVRIMWNWRLLKIQLRHDRNKWHLKYRCYFDFL